MHAGIDLQPATQRLAAAVGFQHAQLRLVVDHGLGLEPAHVRDVRRRVDARQHHHPLRKSDRADPAGIRDRRDPEGIGAFQREGDALEPVAITVGLDHGHDLRVRCQLPNQLKIVAQRREMDRRANRPTHPKRPSLFWSE